MDSCIMKVMTNRSLQNHAKQLGQSDKAARLDFEEEQMKAVVTLSKATVAFVAENPCEHQCCHAPLLQSLLNHHPFSPCLFCSHDSNQTKLTI